jgi:FKBP-type peptidyl-prolyl cis-trans isomerase
MREMRIPALLGALSLQSLVAGSPRVLCMAVIFMSGGACAWAPLAGKKEPLLKPAFASLANVARGAARRAKLRSGDHRINARAHATGISANPAAAGAWQTLAGGGAAGTAVSKRVIEPGSGAQAAPGAEVQIMYTGTLTEREWSADDVAACWLEAQTFRAPFGVVPKEGQYYAQQEMAVYRAAFLAHQVDGRKLLSAEFFTEEYVAGTLGVSDKQHAKKLVSAAQKLRAHVEKQETGGEFDSSREAGPLRFVLGDGSVIRGLEVGVASMSEGERAELRIRADMAYGKNGFRKGGKSSGELLIPPFATLSFDVHLLKC